ncbi:MAG: PEP-CTERM sorting domain-containing protein, partial [Acidobacteriota bacterium]
GGRQHIHDPLHSGGGHDAYNYSYGPGQFAGTSIAGANAGPQQYYSTFTLGTIEVFTIADVATPEPSSALLLGGALAGLLAAHRLRRSNPSTV